MSLINSRASAPRTLPSDNSSRNSQTSRLSPSSNLNTSSTSNLSSGRHSSPLSSSGRARNMSLARSASPFASGPVADRNARHAERLRIISDRAPSYAVGNTLPSRFANTSKSSSAR